MPPSHDGLLGALEQCARKGGPPSESGGRRAAHGVRGCRMSELIEPLPSTPNGHAGGDVASEELVGHGHYVDALR